MSAHPAYGAPRRRRRWVLPTLAVLAALVTAGGAVVAVRAYTQTAGPDGAVRGYLEALARSDAPTALAYGTIPSGPRTLLTSEVLREQQRIAPIEDISVRTASEQGDKARVRASYTLGFAGDPVDVSVTVGVRRGDGEWGLDGVAVETQVQVVQASQRATLAGSAVPEGSVLMFPGAVPIEFDTPYLQVKSDEDVVSPDAGATTQVGVVPSTAGRTAALVAVRNALRTCLAGKGDLLCPQPTERYVPDSIRGTLAAPVDDALTVEVGDSTAGVFELRGSVSVRGSFRRLEFDNTLTTKRDTTFSLPVRATSYAVAPIALRWDRPT